MTRSILIIITLLGLTACSVIQPPERSAYATYTLRLTSPQPAKLNAEGVVLSVDEPRAGAGLDSPRMVYLSKPYAYDYFGQSQWADNPSKLLHAALINVLEGSGAFASVVTNGSGVSAPLRLDSELLLLEQDFTAAPCRVRMAFRVQLVNTARSVVKFTQTYRMDEACVSEDAYGGVLAANRLLDQWLPRLAADIAAQVR